MSNRKIAYLITRIDALISEQISVILQHPAVQALEASWRALAALSSQATGNLLVRVLDSAFHELQQDMRSKLEFDQTHLFDKIYSAEFGTPGGQPYSLLIGDYFFDIKNAQHVLTLTGISQIATAAFAPFISSIQFESLNIASYANLLKKSGTRQLAGIQDYTSWQRFRRSEDACFVGLILPKVLIRRPYHKTTYANSLFQFSERHDATNTLWGHPAYLFALSVMNCFKQTAWFDQLNKTALNFVPIWQHLEYFLDQKTENILNHIGIMTLSQRGYHHPMYCYSSFAVQRTKIYDTESATLNAKIAAILKYVFCVSRFAHYIKVIARDKIGSFQSNLDLQNYLNQWVGKYVAANELSDKMRSAYPLKDAQITVIDRPGRHSLYECIIRLMPRLDLESANFSLQLVTMLGKN